MQLTFFVKLRIWQKHYDNMLHIKNEIKVKWI